MHGNVSVDIGKVGEKCKMVFAIALGWRFESELKLPLLEIVKTAVEFGMW